MTQTEQKNEKYLFQSPQKLTESISTNNNFLTEEFKSKLEQEDKNSFTKTAKEKVGEQHPFDYSYIEKILKKVGLISAIIDKIRDYILGDGINFDCDNDEAKDFLYKWVDKTYFENFIDRWIIEGFAKGTSYLEVSGLSDMNVQEEVKNINSNSIFIKRDEYGRVKEYNQYFGSLNRISDENVNELDKNNIIQLDINKLDSCAYGYGIIYQALSVIDDFLSSQKSSHKLLERKANSPLHVKLGGLDENDIPTQADINSFGKDLQYLNSSTEFVTGPNVEMKVLDFGNLSEKVKEVVNNDLKLIAYAFQVPEVLLGAESSYAGSSDVQIKSFEKNVKSYRRKITYILKTKLFDKLLEKNDFSNVDYKIYFDVQTEEEKYQEIQRYSELLSGKSGISTGMKKYIEKKLADLINIDYDEVEKENEEAEKKMEQQMKQQPNDNKKENEDEEKENLELIDETGFYNFGITVNENLDKAPQEVEAILQEEYKLCEHMSNKVYEDLTNNIDEVQDYTISEWLNFDLRKSEEEMLSLIAEDNFVNLAAKNRKEIYLGKFNKKQLEQLREVLRSGVRESKTVNQIAKDINKIENLRDRKIVKRTAQGVVTKLALSKEQRPLIIARTEITRLGNEATIVDYEKKGKRKLRYRTTDPCPICAPYEGTIYNVSEAYGILPRHVNCRCYFEEAYE